MPAAQNTPSGVNAALQPDPDTVIPRLQLGEQGFLGLRTRAGYILEETNRAFRYPQFIKTVNEIRTNTTVGAAMNVYKMMISRVGWDVAPPVGASQVDLERAKIIKTMMGDMEQSWSSFIESVVPYLEYGFGVNEKVLRRRLNRNGSKYNDGLVGIRKLPTRSQDTIIGWRFDPTGADLQYIEQTLRGLENGYRFVDQTNERGMIEIQRSKFLLFTASENKGNPEGNSIYKNIYLSYKRLELLTDQELLGIAKDVQGILKIEIPAKYLDPNANADDKSVVAGFQTIIDNYNAGTQRGLLVPLVLDPETKQPMFKYELMADRGTPKFNTNDIIKRFQNDILSALNVDVLRLGADGTGSFSLAETKNSILALAIDYRLREIKEVLNADLMRTIYEMNGWSTENMATFEYADIEQIDIDTFSKAVQRIFSVSAIEADRQVMNRVREVFGVAPKDENEEVDADSLPANMAGVTSSGGEGMQSPTGNGTSTNPFGTQNASDNNSENAA